MAPSAGVLFSTYMDYAHRYAGQAMLVIDD